MSSSTDTELRQMVEDRIDELLGLVRQHHPQFPMPNLTYYDNKLAAGYAHYHKHRISLNMPMLRDNTEDMLHETVAHEIAHLVVFYVCGRRAKPHGSEWKQVMRDMFNVEPQRLHNYDTSTTNAKRQVRWAAECACQTHYITTTKQMRIATGRTKYICNTCENPLSLTGERK